MFKTKIIFFLAFLFLISVGYVIHYDHTYHLKRYKESVIKEVYVEYNAIAESFDSLSRFVFNHFIDNKEIKTLLKEAKDNPSSQEEIRHTLFSSLSPLYQSLKHYDMRQLHFHLPDAVSFLRFHKPGNYGDSLKLVRESLNYVNKHKTHLYTFEEGRVFDGFRYIDPLLLEGELVATVEIAYSFQAIKNQAMRINPAHYLFILEKSNVQNKVWKSELKHYKNSEISDKFYYDRTSSKENSFFISSANQTLSKLESVHEGLESKKAFAQEFKKGNQYYLAVFLPIKNIQDKTVAYFISYKQDEILYSLFIHYYKTLAFVFLNIIVFWAFWIKIKRKDEKIKATLNNAIKETHAILDGQHNIVVMTDGETLIYSNHYFLDFMGFESLEAFLDKYKCICELFREHPNFYTPKENEKSEYCWIEYLLKEQENEKKRLIALKDKHEIEHYFEIIIDRYHIDESKYIVTLKDVTEHVVEQNRLYHEATHDKLTEIYNRNFLLQKLSSIQSEDKQSLIMLDIDFFKKINDTYGHDVGDLVLQRLAFIVQHTLRLHDFFGRWGGEEFMIYLLDTDIKSASIVAEKLRNAIRKDQAASIPAFTCSFGVVEFHATDNLTAVLKEVDKRLYYAKENGRDCVINASLT